MKSSKVIVGVLTTSLLAGLVFAGNVGFATRDESLTIGLESFEPDQIISNRLWVESPIQILHTYMAKSTRFVGVGVPGVGGLPFAERLKFNFGEDQVDQSQPPLDLRDISKQERAKLEAFVQRLSYRSLHPCPHDLEQKCTIAIGWNRERRKESNMTMLVVRISDSVYLIVDDSLFKTQRNGS